jgi:hypothetical protein
MPENKPEYSARLDQGDLDAALARVRISASMLNEGLFIRCSCGVPLRPSKRWNINMLDLVELVAAHQKTCAAVGR